MKVELVMNKVQSNKGMSLEKNKKAKGVKKRKKQKVANKDVNDRGNGITCLR